MYVHEPHLQPLSGEHFDHASANTENKACLDVCAQGFWRKGQETFFNVMFFYHNAPSYQKRPLSTLSTARVGEEAPVWSMSPGCGTRSIYYTSDGHNGWYGN